MAQEPYSDGVASVAPETSAPSDYIRLNVSPEQFGAGIGRGLERLGQGAETAGENVFKLNDYYDKISVDDQINKLMDTSDKIRRGDPTATATGADGKPILGPDGKPQPDVGYLGTTGRTALDAREPTMKALDDAIKAGRDNLKSDSARLAYDNQSRRMRSMWADQIGAHSDQQFKTWAADVNATAAQHALNHIAANPEGAEFAHGASDLINARVQEVQSKYGDDPKLKAEAIASAKQEALKTQLMTIGARDPSRALQILDKNRAIAGDDYPSLVEHFRGRADQQDGIAAADRKIAEQAAKPARPALSDEVAAEVKGDRKSGVTNPAIPPEGRALLDHIASTESGGRYDVRYGGGQDKTFQGYGDHPRIAEPITSGPDVGKTSTAAGRYQFIAPTWDAEKQKLELTDFSPANQDAAAWDLAQTEYKAKTGKDLLTVLKSGDQAAISDVPRQLSGQWSSLPGGRQPAGGGGSSSPPTIDSIVQRETALKQQILTDPEMIARPQMQSAALNRVNEIYQLQTANLADSERQQRIAEQQKKQVSEDTENNYLKLIYAPTDNAQPLSAVQIVRDDRLSREAKDRLIKLVTEPGNKDDKTYGSGFVQAFQMVHAPDGTPGRITDVNQLYSRIGPHGDLTMAGVEKLRGEIGLRKTPEGAAESDMKKEFLRNARGQISGSDEGLHIKDPKGDELYLRFMAQALPAYDAGRKAGKSPQQLLDPDSPDYVGKIIRNFKRPMDQWFNDTIHDQQPAAGAKPAFDIASVKSLDDLVTAYRAGNVTKQQADQMAISNGWAKRKTAAPGGVPAPPASQ